MHQLVGYHRPQSITDAVDLLAELNRMALAGGTTITHDGGGTPVEVVDLQVLSLTGISNNGAQGVAEIVADHDGPTDSDMRFIHGD